MTARRTRAFAMVEVVMATAIVGGIAVAALTLVGSVAKQKADAAVLARGQALCRMFAEEVATRPANDWNDGGMSITLNIINTTIHGPDAKPFSPHGSIGNRSAFNTIDDYVGCIVSPPQFEDGTVIPGYSDWSVIVDVSIPRMSAVNSNSTNESGLRRISVQAIYNGKPIATTTFLRSSEWERVMP